MTRMILDELMVERPRSRPRMPAATPRRSLSLTVAVTGLDDDSRQRIATCDTGAAAAPAASGYLTALAVAGPLLLAVALGCAVRAHRRATERRTTIIIGLGLAITVIALPVGLVIATRPIGSPGAADSTATPHFPAPATGLAGRRPLNPQRSPDLVAQAVDNVNPAVRVGLPQVRPDTDTVARTGGRIGWDGPTSEHGHSSCWRALPAWSVPRL
ncbi:MAG: hypothetical protein JXA67_14615 [Micromonosporaceae bacterium]|nr:hypothetical protein [Micromonosporaceae bacterium]